MLAIALKYRKCLYEFGFWGGGCAFAEASTRHNQALKRSQKALHKLGLAGRLT